MLAKRIIPTILVRGRQIFKGQRFDAWRNIGHAAQAIRVHARRGVDEICILDIGATAEGRQPDLGLIRELSEEVFVPLTVGGGVRSLGDIDALLRAGADKVCIGTGAIEVRDLIEQAARRFGSQAIVVSLDIKKGGVWFRCGSGIFGLLRHDQPLSLAEIAKHFADQGAGEILLQSIDRDGMMQGYDLDLIREVSSAVSVPVIASGGCGTPQHMLEAIQAGADAVATGAMLAFTDHTPRSCAEFLKKHGVHVRT